MNNFQCPECGVDVVGKRRDAKTCGSARCTKAAQRRRANAGLETQAEPGAVRVAVDRWLDDLPNAPAVLAASLQTIASELDRAPRHSALWGRFSDLVQQLRDWEAVYMEDASVVALMEHLRGGEAL